MDFQTYRIIDHLLQKVEELEEDVKQLKEQMVEETEEEDITPPPPPGTTHDLDKKAMKSIRDD